VLFTESLLHVATISGHRLVEMRDEVLFSQSCFGKKALLVHSRAIGGQLQKLYIYILRLTVAKTKNNNSARTVYKHRCQVESPILCSLQAVPADLLFATVGEIVGGVTTCRMATRAAGLDVDLTLRAAASRAHVRISPGPRPLGCYFSDKRAVAVE
jgi:hypothetical protein